MINQLSRARAFKGLLRTGTAAVIASALLSLPAVAQTMLRTGEPLTVNLGNEWRANGMDWGTRCLRFDTQPGQGYELSVETATPGQKWAVLYIKSGENCTGKDVRVVAKKDRAAAEFRPDGGSFFVDVRSNPGDVTVRLVAIDKPKIHLIRKGLDLPPVAGNAPAPQLAQAEPAVQQPQVSSAPGQVTLPPQAAAPTPVASSPAGALRYAGGIAAMGLGDEITGNTSDGAAVAGSAGPTALVKFEGTKGQEICVRAAGPAGTLTTVFMEYAKKGDPKLNAIHGTYPTDPFFNGGGAAMRITLPKTGTYYLWPRIATIPKQLSYGHNWSFKFPGDFAGQWRNGEFAIKLWDARGTEPASQSELMREQDRPTYVNGVNYGVYMAAFERPLVTETRTIVSADIRSDGSLEQTWSGLVQGAPYTVAVAPKPGAGAFQRTEYRPDGSVYSNRVINLGCDGNFVGRSQYGDAVEFFTKLPKGTNFMGAQGDPGNADMIGTFGFDDKDAPSYSPFYYFYHQKSLYAVSEANVALQLFKADYDEREERKLQAIDAQNRREEQARQARVWAGVLGEFAKVGDYTAQNTQQARQAVGNVSPYQGFKDMDPQTAARARQLAQTYNTGSQRREPESGPGRRDREEQVSVTGGATASGGKASGSGIIISAAEPAQVPRAPEDGEVTVYMACIWKDSLTRPPARLVYSRIGSMKTTSRNYTRDVAAWTTASTEAFAKLNGNGAYYNCHSGKDRDSVQRQIDETAEQHRNLKFTVTPVPWSP